MVKAGGARQGGGGKANKNKRYTRDTWYKEGKGKVCVCVNLVK